MSDRVFSVGHSNRALDEFVAILRGHGVGGIADVRRRPASSRHPQFNREELARSLPSAGIEYTWIGELGGMRTARADSRNPALADDAFRGYADHLATAEFERGVRLLLELAARRPTAVMCAEADWRGCHRSILCDELVARGVDVMHLLDAARSEPHVLSRGAKVAGGHVSYPADVQLELGFR